IRNREEFGKNPEEKRYPGDRVIERYSTGLKGPALIVIADTIAGEFSGMNAFLRVLESLKKLNLSIRGEVVGLAGNTGSSTKVFLDLEDNGTFDKRTGTLYNNGETQG